MNYDKLTKTLRQHGVSCVRAHGRYCSICDEAATALSTLQAENKRLNKIVCSIPTTPDSGRTVSQYDKEMSMCAYLDDLEAENEKLRAELEQVKMECDAAKSTLAERIGVRGAEPITTAFGLPIDRLRELAKADREGRCVVLPCKIDDDVYINLFGRTLDATVISISELASTPTYKAMYGIRLCYIFKADDVGRTVFLTREAAEEALKAREQE